LQKRHTSTSFNQNIILKHLTSYNNGNTAIILLSLSGELKIVDIANEIDLHREHVSHGDEWFVSRLPFVAIGFFPWSRQREREREKERTIRRFRLSRKRYRGNSTSPTRDSISKENTRRSRKPRYRIDLRPRGF